jgi:carboxymethylenebutenolidase
VSDDLTAQTILLGAPDGADIQAYLVRPLHGRSRGGVVQIHHLPGFDRATKEMTRRIAVLGYDAICPNLFYREAPGAAPDDAAAAARAQGGVPDERLVGDVAAAADYLRVLPTSNGKVAVIGHCSGGRQAVLAGCELSVDAVVDCYGASVLESSPEGAPIRAQSIAERLPQLSAPLLGLFGNDDSRPSPSEVDKLEALLGSHGKRCEFHRYDGAGHAFFAVDRPAYRVEAAVDGWQQIARFFTRHLA